MSENVDSVVIKWTAAFLQWRTMRVKVRQEFSDWVIVLSGVPHGYESGAYKIAWLWVRSGQEVHQKSNLGVEVSSSLKPSLQWTKAVPVAKAMQVLGVITRRPASADRTARRQFQATGQPVSRTQASDAMTSRLPRYEAKCVQRRCFQCESVHLRSDIKGTELPPASILIPLERQLIALQLFCWEFLYSETFQQTFRHVLSKLSKRRQI